MSLFCMPSGEKACTIYASSRKCEKKVRVWSLFWIAAFRWLDLTENYRSISCEKKSTLIPGFIKARESDKKRYRNSLLSCIRHQKDNFYGIRQFIESSFVERKTAGIDPWLLPYTGYDFTRYDNHTVRTRLLCVRHLGIWDRYAILLEIFI